MTKDTTNWWVFTLPAFIGTKSIFDGAVLIPLALALVSFALLSWAFTTGGFAWADARNRRGPTPIPGPRGLPIVGHLNTLSRGLAHRALASMALSQAGSARQLMALSLGSTPLVVASDPQTARELLTSPHMADRPLKLSAKSLMFGRAIGFAPSGSYWRLLRRIASTHLFSPRRLLAHEAGRRMECAAMVGNIEAECRAKNGVVSSLRRHLQTASLKDVMGSVFGKRYGSSFEEEEGTELREMVREGFELLGSFNWSDHIPWLAWFYDPVRVAERSARLVPRVRRFVRGIIDEHRRVVAKKLEDVRDDHDFVDVLLSLEGDEKLEDDDIISVLWEMIFRGTDTTALLTEWIMAELVLNPEKQEKLRSELKSSVGDKPDLTDAELANLPYLNAVVKETLRVHPPGPLLSWARLSTSDVHLSNGMVVPAHTTAMVNMWAITHDPRFWPDPLIFRPERFVESEGGTDVDVRGSDLRLAPFGAGRRVCPGKNLGLVTVTRWVAELVRSFRWAEDPAQPVDLSEVLKLSCEMKHPLSVVAKQIREF